MVGATLGCVPPSPGYFKAIRAVCDRHGALLILDEVMCGMGRTGTLHAWEQEGVVPDIQMIAKGLGGGYQPIGGILVQGRVDRRPARRVRRAQARPHLRGAPGRLRGRAGGAAVIARGRPAGNVRARGAQLESGCGTGFAEHPNVGDIRGRGLFWAIELVADRATKAPFPAQSAMNERVKQAVFAHGLACYAMGGTIDGRQGDHVLLAPPYIADAAAIDTIADRFAAGVADALQAADRLAA